MSKTVIKLLIESLEIRSKKMKNQNAIRPNYFQFSSAHFYFVPTLESYLATADRLTYTFMCSNLFSDNIFSLVFRNFLV